MKYDLAFVVGELLKGHIGMYPKFRHDLWLDVETELVPGVHIAVIDALGALRYQAGPATLSSYTCPRTLRTRPAGVEGEFLRTWRRTLLSTIAAPDGLLKGDLE